MDCIPEEPVDTTNTDTTVSIVNVADFGLSIYPNPTNNVLNIEIDNNTFNSIFIYNYLGKLLEHKKMINNDVYH